MKLQVRLLLVAFLLVCATTGCAEQPGPVAEKPKTAAVNSGTVVSKPDVTEEPGLSDETTNSIGMKLKLIPAGEFLMGSPESDDMAQDRDKPQHKVRITQAFYLGVHEVTQQQYETVMGTNPSKFKDAANPVERVSWCDAVEFCKKLSAKEGKTYRLPTEAEWEYACRAGTTTVYSFADESELGEYAWCANNSGDKPLDADALWKPVSDSYKQRLSANNCQPHRVGQKKPNAWGLHDMHGNISEWCQDWYGEYSSDEVTDPQGSTDGSNRVFRGACWHDAPMHCRSAFRGPCPPDRRSSTGLGFRVVMELPGK